MVLQALGISFVVSAALMPVLRRLGRKWGVVAKPSEDRWHRSPTPILGGVGMFLGVSLAIALTGAWQTLHWSLLLAPALIFLLGLYDDFRPVSPQTKLIGQILAASLLVFFGFTIDFFPWTLLNILLTLIWLVAITNAINLLDNMDGLAAGVALIAAGFLAYFYWSVGNLSLAAVSLAFVGAMAGFLIFNFPPASIFMGDGGSLFLGFSLATLAIVREPRASNVFAVMGPPILLFLLPIIDMVLVSTTRILRGQSPVHGGRDHTSHRLVSFGLPERQTVLVLYVIAFIAGVAGTTLEVLNYDLSLVLVPVVLISLALLGAYLGRLQVVPSSLEPSKSAITRIAVDLTFRRRILEIVLDSFLITLAYYLAYWTWLGFGIQKNSAVDDIIRTLPVALGSVLIAYFVFGIYKGVWRYVGVEDLVRYVGAVVIGTLLAAGAIFVAYPSDWTSPVVFFLFGIYLFLGLVGSRFSFRVFDRIYGLRPSAEARQVLIYGAGDKGVLVLNWILRDPDAGYRPVGFIDDDPLLRGRRIHGLGVLGSPSDLASLSSNIDFEGVIIALDDSIDGTLAEDTSRTLRDKGIWLKRMRIELEPLE